MDPEDRDQRLNVIATAFTLVHAGLHGPEAERRAAQQQLLERYGGAVRRYLHGAVRDPEAADELFQEEFALRLFDGNLAGFDPQRGRFRDFLKGILFHLIADHHNRERRRPRPLPANHPDPAVGPPTLSDLDRGFVTSWRDDLLARSWAALSAVEKTTGQLFYTVLRFRADHPDMPSAQMAAELSRRVGKPLTAAGVRQTLHRAREKFAGLLLDEVVYSLAAPTPELLEQELGTLGLIEFCRPALERRAKA